MSTVTKTNDSIESKGPKELDDEATKMSETHRIDLFSTRRKTHNLEQKKTSFRLDKEDVLLPMQELRLRN